MRRPLVVIGKGAAYSQADGALRSLVAAGALPFLATAMGRGVVPDSHPLNVNPARSAALRVGELALRVVLPNNQVHMLGSTQASCYIVPGRCPNAIQVVEQLGPSTRQLCTPLALRQPCRV